jgi:SAM-dependent methyltransferase
MNSTNQGGQINAEFDVFADNYEELLSDPIRDRFAKSSEYFHKCKLNTLLRYLKKEDKDSQSLTWLDLGCGRGDLLRLGRSKFRAAFGCDVSPASLKYCDVPVRVQENPTSIPFAAGSFDVVTAACVYHHVDADERAALTESARAVLRPGGTFGVFEHNPYNLFTRIIVRRSPVDINAVLLYPSETVALMRRAGFSKIAVFYYLFIPEIGKGVVVPFLENWLHWLPLGGQYAVFGSFIH